MFLLFRSLQMEFPIFTKMNLSINLSQNEKIYFLSDLHLGAPDYNRSFEREQRIIQFLKSIEEEAQAVFFVGDTFDFWFEYQLAVPKYFVRFFAQLIQLKEKGIEVYMFTGNHDLWLNNYLQQELGVTIFHERVMLQSGNHSIFVAHGDGLGPGDLKYKILKKIFTNPACIWMFRWLHPDIGIRIAHLWSRHSFTDPATEVFQGEEKEWLIQYCKRKLEEQHFDYFIMGHRHLPMKISLHEKSTYINLGDWLIHNSYAVFDGTKMNLLEWK